MGTTFTVGATQKDIVNELLESLKREKRLVVSALKHEDGEPVFWTVEKGKSFQYIGCYVLREDNDNNWGYKPMDETMGPCFYSVPLKWLDKYPCSVQSQCGKSWREKVKKMNKIA